MQTPAQPRATPTPYRLISDLLSMIRFSHTLFALPFAFLGAALAAWSPEGWHGTWRDWLGVLCCMVGARSAAMAFNRLVDRDFDAANPRTAIRHLPTGRLSVKVVVLFTLLSAGVFIGSTLLFLPNRWPLFLSVPVLIWLLGYSYAKRFTPWSHYWLGLALALAPLAAWIGFRGNLAWSPVILGLAVFFWVGGFDVIYACQDVDFDRSKNLKSIPSWLGVRKALRLASLSHAITVVALLGLGWTYPMGTIYFVGVVVVAGLLVYEHSLVKSEDLSRVNRAFFQVNIVISLGILVVGVGDLLFRSR